MKLGAAKRSLPVGYAGVITATPTTSRQIRFQATDSAILWPMRRIVFAAVPPIQILDLTAPLEIFARCGGYGVELVSTASEGDLVSSSCG